MGGTSGTLVLVSTDRVTMTDACWYSVISPEGAAAILWRDPERKREAAAALHLTPAELLSAGLVDMVVPHSEKPAELARMLRSAVLAALHRAQDAGPDAARRTRGPSP